MIVVFDIDGTLSNSAHREEFAIAKEWGKFHSLCHLDPPITPTLAVLQALAEAGHDIEIWTARPTTYVQQTKQWLFDNAVDYHNLVMRKAGDWRHAYIVKLEWYLCRAPRDRPAVVFEDHPETTRLLRAAGATVYQVAERERIPSP